MIPFGEYLPDLPALQNPGATVAKNVFPAPNSYLPWPGQVSFSDAIDARPRGGLSVVDKSGNRYVFLGSDEKLYSLASNVFTDVSKAGSPAYSLATEETWEFAKWGEVVLAASGVNTAATNNLQALTLGGATFADLSGSPPQARHIAVVRDFVVIGNTWDSSDGLVPNRMRWSGIGDETTWAVSASTQADFEDLYGGGGWVQRIAGGEYGVVFQESSIWRMTYAGSPVVWQFDEVLPGRGTPAPGSVAQIGDMVFFLSQDGFEVVVNGSSAEPIGAHKVDRTFYADLDATYIYRITSAIDPINRRVYWAYPGVGNSDGTPNKVLCYDWAANRWSFSEQAVELLLPAATAGYTLDQLDTFDLGSELVTNGAMAADTDWTKGTGWTIGSGVASSDGSQTADSDLTQTVSITEDLYYYVSFTVSNYSAGNVTAVVGDNEGTDRAADGTFTETIQAGSGGDVDIRADADFVGDIDDVSVKQATSLDALPESLDSRIWQGDAAQIALVDTDNMLAFWSGDNLTATLETAEAEVTPGRRALLNGIRPLVDGGTSTVKVASRNRLQDSVTYGASRSVNGNGLATTRKNARYHRIQVTVTGDWTHAQGVDVTGRPAGVR